jgi:hypothetical protein
MTDPTDAADQELRRLFGRLRAHELANGPEFERLTAPQALRQARHDRRARRLRAVAVAGGLLGLTTVLVFGPDDVASTPDRAAIASGIDLGSVYWRAPTDFLLDTPGRALLQQVPTFAVIRGQARSLAPAPPTESTATPIRRPQS